MNDLPDWIHQMKNGDEEKMKQHSMKVKKLMVEVNRMINEEKKMKKFMEDKLNEAIREWTVGKKK